MIFSMRGAAFIYPGRPVLPPEHGRPTTLPSPGPNQNGRLYRRLLGLSLQGLPLRPSKAAEWLDNTGFVHRYILVEVCEAGEHAEGVEKGIAEVVAQVEQIMDQDQVAVGHVNPHQRRLCRAHQFRQQGPQLDKLVRGDALLTNRFFLSTFLTSYYLPSLLCLFS